MKKFMLLCISFGLLAAFVIPVQPAGTSQYKCMIQLTNYTGEGAYIVVSVLDKDGNYLQSLQVLGDDEEWYPDLTDWWDYFTKNNKPDIDAITGATIAGGERSLFVLSIADELLNAGNILRFETAVEDQKYVKEDVQLPLTAATLSGKFEGSGYIRYVRMIPNK